MAEKYDDLARSILENVGGAENVASVAHCITRVRFKLKDESRANTAKIEALKGVIQVIQANGQYQVVVGNIVEDVYDAVLEAGSFSGGASADDEPQGDKTVASVVIDLISGIFQPILGPLAAAGIMKGLLALITYFVPAFGNDGLYTLLYTVADGFFYFLPIILGYTAAKKFGCSEFVGMTLGIALTYPAMVNITSGDVLGTVLAGTPFAMNYYTTFLGIPVIMPSSGYTSSVIPIIISVWFAAKLEKWCRKHFSEYVKFFFVPTCVLVVMVPATYLIIGPIAPLITNLMSLLFNSLYSLPVIGGALGGIVLTAIWQPMVIFGFHWSVIALMLVNIASQGWDIVMAPYMVCSYAQSLAVLAILLKTKDVKLKQLAWPAFISGFFFGITEPCIYGVTLPRKKPFIMSCIASVPGGLIIGALGTKMFAFTGGGFCAFPGFIDPSGAMGANYLIYVIIAIVVSSVISFLLTYATYKEDVPAVEAAK